ncbi:MAG: DUF2269 family protein [Candidatus Dormibacteria bacterium]
MNWFLFWLFLHITAAVLAFGPIFVFPIIGTLAAKAPQNMKFVVELNHRIETRLVLPFALSMVVSGSGLLWTANINWFATPYLIVGVVLYLIATTLSIGFLLPNTRKLLNFVEHAPAPVPGAATAGPPPQVMRLIRRNQIAGGITTVLFLIIIFLMIIQPGGINFRM